MFAAIRDAAVAAANLFIAGIGGAMNAVISAWPINMPTLPTAPPELGTAFAWVRWSPLPVDAGFALLLFLIGVWLAWFLVAPVLRWAKVID
jgi:hypothetical protein